MTRIYLSPPHLSGNELAYVQDALNSNWIAPLGPHVDAFERELAQRTDVAHALALSSGTAALHLALVVLGVGRGDTVLCSTLTFAASANVIRYVGATPVFIDAEPESWNIDPQLVAQELAAADARNELPKAVIAVDLYGQSADYDRLRAACAPYGVPIVQDAAEALGASYRDRPVGGQGDIAVFSFNGNKVITCSGGGMLVSARQPWIDRARYLSTQARRPTAHYEHSDIGFNYRLSNLLAAVGRAQLEVLDERVAARRRNFAYYAGHLAHLSGVAFMPEAAYGRHSRWLSCMTVDATELGVDREQLRHALADHDIEARPLWKPMHQQPVFADCRVLGGQVADQLFAHGLCLPSGSALTDDDLARITDIVLTTTDSR